MASIKSIANSGGLPWGSVVMGLLMLAFILYIAGTGSLPKYKQMLF